MSDRQDVQLLQNGEAPLVGDLAALRRFSDLQRRLATETDLRAALDAILAAACEFTGTERGCVQLGSGDGRRLELFVWRGYGEDSAFVKHLQREGTKERSDIAGAQPQRVIVEDWQALPPILAEPGVDDVVRAEEIRASQSTPMVSRNGDMLGVLSTQFMRRHRPTDDELRFIDLLAWIGAEFVERHRAGVALRDSDTRLRLVIESVKDYAIFTLDKEGTITSWNDGARRLKGYTADEIVGQPVARFYTADDVAVRKPQNEMRTALRTGHSEDESWRIHKNGSLLWINEVMTPLLSPDGAHVGFTKISRDLTERRATEDRLRASEERLRLIVESAHDYAILTTDVDGRIESWSVGAARIFGWMEEEAVGQHVRMIFTPEDQAGGAPESEMRTAREQGRSADERWHLTKAGGRFYASGVLTPLKPDGVVRGYAKIARDLTERKQLEDAQYLAREQGELQKRLLYSLFMQAPTHIAVLRGPDHIIELANPPVCELWGHAEADLLGRPLLEMLPELRDQVVPELLDGAFRTGTPYVGMETPVRLERRDGTTDHRYLNFAYSPFRNGVGSVEGIFVIASDVTEQVLARNQVNSLREAAESSNRAKDEFLAMLGHELRNPLSPIVTALHVMRLRGTASERERLVIERQVAHLTRLVDDLLDVSRIAGGKVELKDEIVEVADVVAPAIEMSSPLLEQRRHTVAVHIPRTGLAVRGDRTRLSQVVSNLVTNAAKYTPPGGHISIRADEERGDVVLRVRDTGSGIAPDVLPHIFDLFVQERQALDRSQGGLGLGLTIVRNLIARHGGSVSAHSDGLGTGSEFVVRLPRVAVPLSHAPASASEGAVVRQPCGADCLRILVVDDNIDAADMLATALNVKGHDARVAHDAPTALRLAREFDPAVAFLDIGLPVIDGYELARRLRKQPDRNRIRLVAVTGYGQNSDREKSRQAGFDEHLVKPVTLDAIDAVLDGSTQSTAASTRDGLG